MTNLRFNNSIVPSVESVLLATAIALWLDPQANALTLTLAPANSGDVITINPPGSPSSQGTLFIGACGPGFCEVQGFPSAVEPGEFVWGWEVSQETTSDSVPVAALTFPYGGGAITEPSTVVSNWLLDGEIYAGGGLQISIGGPITWETILPDGATGAIITGDVDVETFIGSSPMSPISTANLSDFGKIQFTIDCGDVSCLKADPTATVTSMSFDYSYKGGVVPELSSWAMLLLGFGGLGLAGWRRAVSCGA
jgi:hypothetical protein